MCVYHYYSLSKLDLSQSAEEGEGGSFGGNRKGGRGTAERGEVGDGAGLSGSAGSSIRLGYELVMDSGRSVL